MQPTFYTHTHIPRSLALSTVLQRLDCAIHCLQIFQSGLQISYFYASVRMRSEAYGSHFVCVTVCLFRAHLLFPWTLGTGKCFYGYYTVFSKYAICRFARQSLVFEIWQYLLTSKAFVSAYESSKSKAVLSMLPFGLNYRTVQ